MCFCKSLSCSSSSSRSKSSCCIIQWPEVIQVRRGRSPICGQQKEVSATSIYTVLMLRSWSPVCLSKAPAGVRHRIELGRWDNSCTRPEHRRQAMDATVRQYIWHSRKRRPTGVAAPPRRILCSVVTRCRRSISSHTSMQLSRVYIYTLIYVSLCVVKSHQNRNLLGSAHTGTLRSHRIRFGITTS